MEQHLYEPEYSFPDLVKAANEIQRIRDAKDKLSDSLARIASASPSTTPHIERPNIPHGLPPEIEDHLVSKLTKEIDRKLILDEGRAAIFNPVKR
jgi:hypothetical protein